MERVIFHVDVNSAFLSWEAAYRLYHRGEAVDLRELPSAVGGDASQGKGIVIARSIPAGRLGIQTGEPVASARRKCRSLILVPPDYSLYLKASRALFRLLGDYTDQVEPYSIDEAFLDMTGMGEGEGWQHQAAVQIGQRIRRELGFTVNIGISSNWVLAKMASDLRKPDQIHTLWPWEIRRKMWPLPVRRLFFAGPAAERKLKGLGIGTIGQLAVFPAEVLEGHLHSQGRLLWHFANGRDFPQMFAPPRQTKSIGNSLTLPFAAENREQAALALLSLAETVGARLRAGGWKAGYVEVGLKDRQFFSWSRRSPFKEPTDLTAELYQGALSCLDRMWEGAPLRGLSVRAGTAGQNGGSQGRLFDWEAQEKRRRAQEAVDSLRKRFGPDCVMRAGFAGTGRERAGISHMGGGPGA